MQLSHAILCGARNAVSSLLAAVLPGMVAAQPTPDEPLRCATAPPTYRFLRHAEDWQSLRDSACRNDYWDTWKHIALGTSVDPVLTLGGDARLVLINARYLSFGNEGGDNHNVLLQRYHAHASLRVSGELRLFAELKSNHQNGREPGPLGTDVDRLDVHQAFVDLGAESATSLRLGRQELVYGSGRRIFPRNGPNVRGNFDALRLVTRAADWRADAFVFRPVAIDPGRFDDNTIRDQTFWGVYATGPHRWITPASLDVYYIGAKRDAGQFQQGAASELRHTLGVRLFGRIDAWDHDHELSLQWGRFGGASIRAWAVASETGYTWRDAARRPRASLRLSVASGDRDPTDPSLQTFNSLLPRGGAVDEGFNVSAANITHLRAALTFDVSPAAQATFAANSTWRTSRRDGVYGPGGGLIRRSVADSTARHVGDSVNVYLLWAIDRHASVDLGAGYFWSGRFVAETGPKRNMAYLTPTFYYRF
jgi:hypothetical protein